MAEDKEDKKGAAAPSGKLRFGIMCTGDELPAAFAKCVEELLAIPGVELSLLIVDATPPIRNSAWQKAKSTFSFKRALWALHARLLPPERLPCYRPVDMSRTFAAVPKIHCSIVRKGKFSQYFRPEDVESIRECKLDFILRFAFGIVRGEILQAARHGVWSFHHGDESKFRGGPPAFWEIYCGEPVTGAILQRLTDRLDGGVILQKCFIKTRKSSHGENLNAIMWATTYMPGRVCRSILSGCAQYLNAPPVRTDAPIFHSPNDFQMIKFFCKTAATWLKQQFTSIFFSPDWNVGVVQQPIHAFLDPSFRPQVQWLAYRKPHCYIADPFLLKVGTKLKLLVEEFDWHSNRGSIVETDLDRDSPHAPSFSKAIDEDVHMSYPYVFEHEGQIYCTPESWQNRGVSLYVFDRERESWSIVTTLIRGIAMADPTPFHYAGRWWLFGTDHDDEVESKLFLWHAPSLLGPWEPHAANPVKMDVRSSRPAGPPFVFKGKLYRPAQDSSRAYGGAVTINLVNCLTTREFTEEPVVQVNPIMGSPYRRGIHTVVGDGTMTVVDGNRLVFAPAFAWRRLKYKLRKLAGREQDVVSSQLQRRSAL